MGQPTLAVGGFHAIGKALKRSLSDPSDTLKPKLIAFPGFIAATLSPVIFTTGITANDVPFDVVMSNNGVKIVGLYVCVGVLSLMTGVWSTFGREETARTIFDQKNANRRCAQAQKNINAFEDRMQPVLTGLTTAFVADADRLLARYREESRNRVHLLARQDFFHENSAKTVCSARPDVSFEDALYAVQQKLGFTPLLSVDPDEIETLLERYNGDFSL